MSPTTKNTPTTRRGVTEQAALAAIEDKANVPRRVARVTDEEVAEARAFTRRNPAAATAAVVAGAAAVGTIVWALVRAYAR